MVTNRRRQSGPQQLYEAWDVARGAVVRREQDPRGRSQAYRGAVTGAYAGKQGLVQADRQLEDPTGEYSEHLQPSSTVRTQVIGHPLPQLPEARRLAFEEDSPWWSTICEPRDDEPSRDEEGYPDNDAYPCDHYVGYVAEEQQMG